MRILLVEKDARNARLIRKAMRACAYAIDCAKDAAEAGSRLGVNTYDLIILETDLPDRDGIELCEELRNSEDSTPIIILTARNSVDDRIKGLDAGADDYLTKPFEIGELLARVRALLRRPRIQMHGSLIAIGDIEVDTRSRRVAGPHTVIPLTNKEYALLEYFVLNADRVIGRAELSEHVWDENFDPFSNLIEVYINRLRKKLKAHTDDRPVLRTMRGSGYILEVYADQVIN